MPVTAGMVHTDISAALVEVTAGGHSEVHVEHGLNEVSMGFFLPTPALERFIIAPRGRKAGMSKSSKTPWWDSMRFGEAAQDMNAPILIVPLRLLLFATRGNAPVNQIAVAWRPCSPGTFCAPG